MNEDNIKSITVNSSSDIPRGAADWSKVDRMSDEEAHQNAVNDPDAQPLPEQAKPLLNVKLIRAKLGMTQEEFASTFQLSLATLRDWEQRRTEPDQAAKTLLRVIDRIPEAVKGALEVA